MNRKKNNPSHSARKTIRRDNGQLGGAMDVNQVVAFLSGVIPFSFLPADELTKVAGKISEIQYPAGTVLFYQGKSPVDYLYVVQKGAVERYFEEAGRKKLRGVLGEGDTYGGISILINNSISVRTVLIKEDVFFYLLPKNDFLVLCQEHTQFSDFFTDTFGKWMIDRSYASIIRENAAPKEENSQFFNLRVENIYQPDLLSCDTRTSIWEAARMMNQRNCSSIFVRENTGDYIGLITDNDLRKKVIAAGYDTANPVSGIMSSPLHTISIESMVSEALLEMMDANLKHLGVRDHHGEVIGVVTNSDILSAQEQSPFFVIREVARTASLDEIVEKHKRLPRLVGNMINSGAKSRIVTQLISSISDMILRKIIEFAIDSHGPPPTEFAFLVMGSEGRMEQTLKTDQDNAIIYADVAETEAEAAKDYFLRLGETVCSNLDRAGYAYCKGNVMAKNPEWCQPVSTWKEYFYKWIRVSTTKDLLRSTIFFDFRLGYGSRELVDDLRLFLFDSLQGWSRFFRDLAVNSLRFKPPIGFFRNFLVESRGEHRNKFDIKKSMTPIVDSARIYALHENIAETSTQERLYRLYLQKVITKETYDELNQAYHFLMQQRLICQIKSIEQGKQPDNFLNPKTLSRLEQTLFREIFKRIESLQTRLSLDFTGSA